MHPMRFLPALAAAATVLSGCEWTSSSGSSSWSSRYDDMNFSGTYRSSSVATSTETVSSSDSSGVTGKRTEKFSYSGLNRAYDFGGTFTQVPSGCTINLATVSIVFEGGASCSFQSSEDGTLTGPGSGKVTTSGWSVKTGDPVSGNVTVTVSYTYSGGSSLVGTDTTTESTSTSVTAITVSQSGQNLTIRFNNGVQMDGKFTAVNQTGSVDDGNAYDTYNAQFEVKGGSDKFVGTLNYDLTTGYRVLDGTWSHGKSTYDIHGVGSSWR